MNQEEWRKLAEQNPMRVTYPSWKPKAHWDALRKRDPWVLMSGTTDWRKADTRKAEFIPRITKFLKTQLCDPPSGMVLHPRPKAWSKPTWYREDDEEEKPRRRRGGF